MTKQPLFLDKRALTTSYTPENVPHREEQISQLASIVTPVLKKERPSNVFIYGPTGSGKTLVTQYVASELKTAAKNNNIPFHIVYVNCKMKRVADTEYRLLAHLANLLGKTVPPTGLPTDQVYKIFYSALDEREGVVIFIIDEIDALIKKVGDELLYNFTRMNQDIKNVKVSIIGISNDIAFTENLDARVRSSLSEEELLFPPYNALQLQRILSERASIAFNKSKVSDGVISKCAALAAQEHGDARRALDLLRVAGELAERENAPMVEEKHVDAAESKVDLDRVIETVKMQPKQSKAILYSIIYLTRGDEKTCLSGDVYEEYVRITKVLGLKPLTQRRVSDIISELDIMGVITSKVISKGRYGRMRDIGLAISTEIYQKLLNFLKSDFGFD
ncbi:orc1/cdc6 family replication initiation protein [archaeon]|nr:orc1/cdc6 family replication initiation protein [archaeon]